MTAPASPLAPPATRELAAWATSIALHAALLAAVLAVRATAPGAPAPVEVEIVERPAPAPAPPPTPAPSAAPPIRATPPRPVRVAKVPPAPTPATAPPPPPNAPAPADAKPAPLRFGVSMSSTTAAGEVAAPTGNTLYGKPPERAPDPAEARPYRAERYAAPTQVSALPQPIRVEVPRSEYPPDAARQGVEGAVRLRLLVDEEGNVRAATLVGDPGHGLGPAAVRAARRYFKFRPALKDGVPVATEIPFTVQFELD